ncbi:MAG: FAD-dependent oxidoreductase [Burkholderiales bacterium]|jgi:NADPH-dependent glutamate synthase beta subunit-like oxidoreductase/NAD(P)H-flavin reductase|nr:FAD-dependent oxidoreductase [Burkholderiales bacterium]
MLKLAYGLTFSELYTHEGVVRLDQLFLAYLRNADASLAEKFNMARETAATSDAIPRKEETEILLVVATYLEDFLAELFGIEREARALAAKHHELAPFYAVKRQFVQRKAANAYKADVAATFDGAALRGKLEVLIGEPLTQINFAQAVIDWQGNQEVDNEAIDVAMRYAAWAVHTPEGRKYHRNDVIFKTPQKIDFMNLVPIANETRYGVPMWKLSEEHSPRYRDGFMLTDQGTDFIGGLDEAHYCIWCHEQDRDSCRKGIFEKSADGKPLPQPFKKTPLGVPLNGCPLDERISEFHKLRAEGMPLAALAMICIDNPMVAATGHRICNDCMKACIYQKQEPVNIPQSETRLLKDVLALPWGFEIYSLLTRWNPLNLLRPYPLSLSGKRVLIAGMGPAGYTLAHHLLNDGHTVVGIDGLKIEPLAESLGGVTIDGMRVPFEPIRNYNDLVEPLGERVLAGFGGVAEYGITVRWDKNFLKTIRLLLQRRAEFALFGGIRFGSTVTLEDAFERGFDHVALALGAGKPTVLDIPNGLTTGVRTASDFLMALQLTGAAKREMLANMQLRLPVIVIGGGLTAIDAATEALAYYPVQVEKFLSRYERLVEAQGREKVETRWTEEERGIAEEFIAHARALREERAAAERENRKPNIIGLLKNWGGATVAYRKRMIDSPSYTLNNEEIEKALEEGIWFAEGLTPLEVETDGYGSARALKVSAREHHDEQNKWREYAQISLPARTILIAAGTSPNTVLAREDAAHFKRDGKYFCLYDENGNTVKAEIGMTKPESPAILTLIQRDGRAASFWGDLHPSYFGNVVKAMASAKQGYPIVSRMLARVPVEKSRDDTTFLRQLNHDWRAHIERVERLTPTILEVVVRAPAAASNFMPGQFYRLQNFETRSEIKHGTRMATEGLALTGAWVDRAEGLVSLIVLEMGGSSSLCAKLKPGEPVILMGPTGAPTEIEGDETVTLVGGGLGNAVLFSISRALREAGSKVLYFAGYRQIEDRYKVEDIEASADVIIWCSDEAPGFVPSRPQDKTFVGNIVEAMRAYAEGNLGEQTIPFTDTDRMIVIGSDRMMAAVTAARHGVLAKYLKPTHQAIGSINSPMQCMMKEICAQCLQIHRDPDTGDVSYVFSCFNQDQSLDHVDFDSLSKRLKQNALQEKLTASWIAYIEKNQSV